GSEHRPSVHREAANTAYRPDATACAAAMMRLVADPTLQRTLRDGARRWAERRTWEHELDRLDTSYREVLRRSAR
ncbi:MAG: glycosyltransferase, partial [Acidimicrobiia bacterium]